MYDRGKALLPPLGRHLRAGWVSLFTLHARWAFLWIWAVTYRPDRGWGFRPSLRRPAPARRPAPVPRRTQASWKICGAVLPSLKARSGREADKGTPADPDLRFDLLRSPQGFQDVLSENPIRFRREPIERRKVLLMRLLAEASVGLQVNDRVVEPGDVVFRHACQLGFEGIVSNRVGSPYRSGRSRDWIKMKNPAAPAVKREAEEDWAKRNGDER